MATIKVFLLIMVLLMTFAMVQSEGLTITGESADVLESQAAKPGASRDAFRASKKSGAGALSSEELLSTCGKKFIKSCEDGGICTQVVCPAEAKSDYACLPRGKNFLQYKLDVCNGEYSISEKVQNERAPISSTPEANKTFHLVYFLMGLAITISAGLYLYQKVTTHNQSEIPVNNQYVSPDFECKSFGEDKEMSSYSDLNDTAVSFDSYMNKAQYFRTPKF